MATLAVHVSPRSGHDEVVGWRGSELAVKVTAAPEGGKATAAACKVVASALGVPRSSVKVVRGTVARHKLLDIPMASDADIEEAFGKPEAPLF